jgi:hypothetical protein
MSPPKDDDEKLGKDSGPRISGRKMVTGDGRSGKSAGKQDVDGRYRKAEVDTPGLLNKPV